MEMVGSPARKRRRENGSEAADPVNLPAPAMRKAVPVLQMETMLDVDNGAGDRSLLDVAMPLPVHSSLEAMLAPGSPLSETTPGENDPDAPAMAPRSPLAVDLAMAELGEEAPPGAQRFIEGVRVRDWSRERNRRRQRNRRRRQSAATHSLATLPSTPTLPPSPVDEVSEPPPLPVFRTIATVNRPRFPSPPPDKYFRFMENTDSVIEYDMVGGGGVFVQTSLNLCSFSCFLFSLFFVSAARAVCGHSCCVCFSASLAPPPATLPLIFFLFPALSVSSVNNNNKRTMRTTCGWI